jgi:hypothetical protein
MNRLLAARKIFKSVIDIKKHKHTTSNCNLKCKFYKWFFSYLHSRGTQGMDAKSQNILKNCCYQSPPTLSGNSQPNQQIHWRIKTIY